MKSKLFLVVLIFAVSCQRARNDFEKVLTMDENYWIFYSYPDEQINNKKVIITGVTKFNKNESFRIFDLHDDKIKEPNSFERNSENEGCWHFTKDSLFNIGDKKFKVVRYRYNFFKK